MNVQGLLDKIEDTIDMGSKIPLSGKVAVDAETIKQCIEDIRYDLPIELEKAQEVVAHHNNLITKANNEASSIVSSAQTEADGIISAAKEKASGIAATAEANAKSTLSAASEQAKQMIQSSEITRLAHEFSDRVRAQATAEAENIVRNARSQADAIILDANNQAQDTKSKADKWAGEIRSAAAEFVEDIMKNSDGRFSRRTSPRSERQDRAFSVTADKKRKRYKLNGVAAMGEVCKFSSVGNSFL